MGEDGGDVEATGALDVHEERAGRGDESLRGKRVRSDSRSGVVNVEVLYLKLVLASLGGRGGVEEIFGENLVSHRLVSFQPS